jgi:membrane associated rhomboid family serine protease
MVFKIRTDGGLMFPVQDETRRPNSFPAVTVGIIVLNAFVFVLELAGGDDFILKWSLIPADFAAGHHWVTVITSMCSCMEAGRTSSAT